MKNAEMLLQQVSALNKKHEEIARITGRKFNVFSILGVESRETSTHSAFLVELLNPKGSHGQGSIFLDLFIEGLKKTGTLLPTDCQQKIFEKKISEIGLDKCSVEKEKYLGRIDEKKTKGGRADIIIRGRTGTICIENKIYADDQEKQLVRYAEKYGKNGLILYLTLWGSKASDLSAKELKVGIDYFKISYKKDILEWLIKCQKEAIDIPIVRDVIGQYIYLIEKLTGQGMVTQGKKEFINLIAEFGKSHNEKDLIALRQSFDVFLKDVEQKLRKLQGKLKLVDYIRKAPEIWTGKDQSNYLNSVLFIPLNQLPEGSRKDLKIRLSPKGWTIELWNGWLGDSKKEEVIGDAKAYEYPIDKIAEEVTEIIQNLGVLSDGNQRP